MLVFKTVGSHYQRNNTHLKIQNGKKKAFEKCLKNVSKFSRRIDILNFSLFARTNGSSMR